MSDASGARKPGSWGGRTGRGRERRMSRRTWPRRQRPCDRSARRWCRRQRSRARRAVHPGRVRVPRLVRLDRNADPDGSVPVRATTVDKSVSPAPDLVRRSFAVPASQVRWYAGTPRTYLPVDRALGALQSGCRSGGLQVSTVGCADGRLRWSALGQPVVPGRPRVSGPERCARSFRTVARPRRHLRGRAKAHRGVVDRHGRGPHSRGHPDSGGRRVHQQAAGVRQAVPGADQQLDLHPA